MPNWINNIKHITTGESVSAGVAGRAAKALEGNLQYLKDLVDSTQLGQVLVIRDVTVASTVEVGQPVYWNDRTAKFEAALAAAEGVTSPTTMGTKTSAEVIGVVKEKKNATLADIVAMGWVALDLSNAIDEEITAGRYYLSSATAGKLVKQRPPVSVPVLYSDGLGNALVMPITRNFLNDHIHYSFELEVRPAGDHSHVTHTDRHVITNPDPSQKGWLPADHASFDGKAPKTAMFGYNLAAHPELERIWPPLPIGAVSIIWDKGDNDDAQSIGGVDIPLGVTGLAVIDSNGIWWMSDAAGDVPWPEDIVTQSSSIVSDGYEELDSDGFYSSSSGTSEWIPESPRFDRMRLVLNFVRMTFATDKTVVTSLQPEEDSPITVKNCDGEVAITGDLHLGLDLNLAINDAELEGHQVIKTVVDSEYQRGPVVEGIFAGSGDITLTSDKTLDVSGDTLYQGRITISRDLDVLNRELFPQIVRLDDVVERYFEEVPYLGFIAERSSSVRFRFNIPPSGLGATPTLSLRVVLIGREGPAFAAATALPALTMSYRRVARPTTATALPTSDTVLTFDTAAHSLTAANQYIEVSSSGITTIEEGDTLLVTISRGAVDTYAGEVGIVRLGAIFT